MLKNRQARFHLMSVKKASIRIIFFGLMEPRLTLSEWLEEMYGEGKEHLMIQSILIFVIMLVGPIIYEPRKMGVSI